MSSMIGVHVFGHRFGESVVLELPGTEAKLGVIDSYTTFAPDQATPVPFLPRFIRRLRPDAATLEFVAITHPHADHCLGIKDLLANSDIRVEKLWLFASSQIILHLEYFYRQLRDANLLDSVAEDLEVTSGAVHAEIKSALDFGGLPDEPRGNVEYLFGRNEIALSTSSAKVFCLTPGPRCMEVYQSQLAKAASPINGSTAIHHNLASGAFAIVWGNTRLLFLADAEMPIWNEYCAGCLDSQLASIRNAHFIKVPHHGSVNGYEQRFYDVACGREKPPVMVITPFNRGVPLPTRAGVDSLQKHHNKLIACTNSEIARASTKKNWQGGYSCPPLPRALLCALSADRKLQGFMSPEFGGPEQVSSDAEIPLKWFKLLTDGRYRRFFHPAITGLERAMDPILDAHRVSFYFDENGNEMDNLRFLGDGTGVLVA